MIEVLETVVFEGRDIVAVDDDDDGRGCRYCIGCQQSGPGNWCQRSDRKDGRSVFFMYLEDAIKARLRGRFENDQTTA